MDSHHTEGWPLTPPSCDVYCPSNRERVSLKHLANDHLFRRHHRRGLSQLARRLRCSLSADLPQKLAGCAPSLEPLCPQAALLHAPTRWATKSAVTRFIMAHAFTFTSSRIRRLKESHRLMERLSRSLIVAPDTMGNRSPMQALPRSRSGFIRTTR